MAVEVVKYKRDQAADADKEIHEHLGYCSSRSRRMMFSLLAEPYVC
jgi:hypothetical protein